MITRKMTLGTIRSKLKVFGFTLSNEVFEKMTYGELTSIYRKAKRANSIKCAVDRFIESKTAPTVERKVEVIKK